MRAITCGGNCSDLRAKIDRLGRTRFAGPEVYNGAWGIQMPRILIPLVHRRGEPFVGPRQLFNCVDCSCTSNPVCNGQVAAFRCSGTAHLSGIASCSKCLVWSPAIAVTVEPITPLR